MVDSVEIKSIFSSVDVIQKINWKFYFHAYVIHQTVP